MDASESLLADHEDLVRGIAVRVADENGLMADREATALAWALAVPVVPGRLAVVRAAIEDRS